MRGVISRPVFFFFFCSLLLLALSYGAMADGKENRTTLEFRVGVILDNETWVGNVSWACMSMAMDDFYSTHPNYTTRVALIGKDSKEDVVSSAAAGTVVHPYFHWLTIRCSPLTSVYFNLCMHHLLQKQHYV